MEASASPPPGRLPREISTALRKFQRRFLLQRALEALALALATGFVLFSVAVLIDRLFLLSHIERWTLTCVAVGATTTLALAGLSRLLFPGGSLRMARRMEAADPRLDEALLSSVEIARLPETERKGFSPGLVRALFRTTSLKLADLKVEKLLDLRRAGLLAAASILLWGAMGGLIAWDVLSLRQLASRFFHPGSDIARPSSVIVEVTPGNKVVGKGDDLKISARVLRGRPSEGIISWRFAEDEWMEARTPLKPEEPPGQPSSSFSRQFTALRRSLEYRVHAGDFWSPTHRIVVRDPPRATGFQVTYRYPPYTGRPPRTVHQTTGDLDAVRGTKAAINITASEPLVRSRIELAASGAPAAPSGAPAASFDLSVAGDSARVEGISLESSGAYRLYLEAAGGVSNGWRAQYSIRALPDRPPVVEILEPAAAEVELEESSSLRVRCSADDDVGLRSLRWIVRRGDEKLQELPLLEAPPEPPSSWTGTREIPVAWLRLRPGESASFFLCAEDTLGNQALSTERGLRIAFLPDPPEGPLWPSPLERIERDLSAARAEWQKLGAGLRGAERPNAAAADPALAENLERVSEKALALRSFLQDVARSSGEAGREIKVPSADRRALERLGAFVFDVAEEDCAGLLEESLAVAGASIAKTREVSTARLLDLHARASASLEVAWGAASSLLLAERLEGALERCLALRSGLNRARRSIEDRALQDRAPGNPPPPESSSLAAAALPSTARILFREAASLGADLARWAGGEPEEVSGGEGSSDAEIESMSRNILERTGTELSALAKSGERDPEAAGALDRALEAASDVAERLSRRHGKERSRQEDLSASIDRRSRAGSILAELAGVEGSASREGPVLREDPVLREGPVPREDRGRLQRDHVEKLAALIRSLQHAMESCDAMPYRDIETSRDLAAFIEIARSMARGASWPSTPGASSPSEASVLRELLSAYRGTAASRALGRAIQEIHHAAGGEDAILWKLRSSPAANLGALHWVLRAQREISSYLGPTREALVELKRTASSSESTSGHGSGSSGEPSPLDRGLESLASAIESMGQVISALEEACGTRLPGAGGLSPEAEEPAPAGRETHLPALASQAARDATAALDRCVRLLEEFRSSGFPDAESARAWLWLRQGSSPERIRALAAREADHARIVRGLSSSAPAAEGAARARELLWTHEEIRRDVESLAVRVRGEGDLSLDAPGAIEKLKAHDGAASKLAALAEEEMLDASRALGEARDSPLDARGGLLLRAAVLEEKAAKELGKIAEALGLVEMDEALASSEAELGGLLKDLPPLEGPAGSSDPAKVLAEARRLLGRTLKAAQVISAKLQGDPRKAPLLSELTGAAELFREAAAAAEGGKGPEAAEVLERGKERLRSAVAMVRRIREESRPAMAKAAEDLRIDSPQAATGGENREASRELEAAYRELEKVLELEAAQDELASLFEDFLGRDGKERQDLSKLVEKAREIEKEISKNILTGEELMDLVSRLLLMDREGTEISRLERTLAADAQKLPEASTSLVTRQSVLIERARALLQDVRSAGFKLSAVLPFVLKAYWKAADAGEPLLEAMDDALAAIEREAATASQKLSSAADKMDVLLSALGEMRRQTLQAIADSERGSGAESSAQRGLERARRGLIETLGLLENGSISAASRAQEASRRSIADGSGALRARIAALVLPGVQGAATDASGGAAWQVLTRGAPLPGGMAAVLEGSEEMPFPAGFRDLIKVYFKALQEAPP